MDEKTVVEVKARNRVGPGTQLNELYQIDSLIAVGGMGEVFRGHVIETGDAVAIKTIRPDFAENANALALFRKEAATLHTVHHGAVVRYYVFSIDRRLDLPYLAMEYVTGESLAEIVKRGPLAYETIDILRRRLASGLQAAHEAGIIHRDVSPDNVILPAGDPSRAKIIDFGIARSPLAGQTVIGDGFAGKYNYVSPEQFGLQGGVVTPRSDIYSLGLVLVEASLGHPLDMGANPADFVAKRSVTPDLTGVDPRLAPLFEAMLRPDPALRPESMADVAAWTAPVRVVAPVQATAHSARGPGRRLVIGAGAAGLLLAAGLAVAVLRPADDMPATGGSGPILVERDSQSGPSSQQTQSSRSDPAGQSSQASPDRIAPPTDPQSVPAGADARDRQGASRPDAPPDRPMDQDRPTRLGSTQGSSADETLPGTNLPSSAGPPSGTDEPVRSDAVEPPVKISSPPTMEDVASYIRSYRGGTCFFLNPTTVSRSEAAIEAYGPAPAPFVAFDTAFRQALGFEARIQLRQIEPAQCAVVDLLARQAAQKPASVPKLRLDQDRIRNGEELRGLVDMGDDRNLKLLLVDGDGSVHDLAPHLKRNGRQASFALRLEGAPSDRVQTRLLVAVASREPFAPARDGMRGEALFQAIGQGIGQGIGQDAGRRDSGVGLAVRYVKTGS